jgi:hypothetical protein
MLRTLLAAAALALSPTAYAHPGHGTAPAPDASGRPHVHFGTPKVVAPAPKALPASDKAGPGKASARKGKRATRQELSHTR